MLSVLDELLTQIRQASTREFMVEIYRTVAGESLEAMLCDFLGGDSRGPLREQDGAWLRGAVAIGERVTIHPGAVIYGPVVLCDDSTVGPNAHLKDGVVLGPGAVAGACCEVKGSVFADSALAWHFSYVGNSIVGCRTRLGASFVSAVLRHDGRAIRVGNSEVTATGKLGCLVGHDCVVGVQVSAMPGSVIADGMLIPPHTIVKGLVAAGPP
jgi:bifunctional UDP-N-acetylglucosamine pyrophosphorylase/glucosamine-1-phosphate N-acetyltransferase